MVKIYDLRINNQINPIGIDHIEEIGWKIHADKRNVRQKAYEFQIAKDRAFHDRVFDSGIVQSVESVHIAIAPDTLCLVSSERYYIRVRVEVIDGEKSDWAEGMFVTALLDKDEWKAEFISPEKEDTPKNSKGYYLRTGFFVPGKVKKAYAYTTAFGLYHFYMNGEKVGKDEFTPGWTDYLEHLLYQVYDVTSYVKEGYNMEMCIRDSYGSGRIQQHALHN